jgi:hypothetical protein
MTVAPITKPTLFVFAGSVWASAPWLAVYVLGLQDEVEIRHLDLLNGANFDPEFVKITPEASLPTIALPDGTVYGSTKTTVDYLLKRAKIAPGKATGSDFIDVAHAANVDPNFALLSARNQAELDAKRVALPGNFIRGRQAALPGYASSAPSDLKSFYDAKLAYNGALNDVYAPNASKEITEPWFKNSQEAWKNNANFILNVLPKTLPESGYIGGERPGEDDFHAIAWLGRVAGVAGGTPDKAGVQALAKELNGEPVPKKVVDYWNLWNDTDAWTKVYTPYGLH